MQNSGEAFLFQHWLVNYNPDWAISFKAGSVKHIYFIEWQAVPDKSETLHWAHFKLSEDDLDRNAVYLCSKGVSVEPLSYEGLKKVESVEGHRFLTAFYGDVLNKEENVGHSS